MPVIIESSSNVKKGYWSVFSDEKTVVKIKEEPEVSWLKLEKNLLKIEKNEKKKIFYYIDDKGLKEEGFTEVFFIPEAKGNVVARIGAGFYLWPEGKKPKPKLKIKLKMKENFLVVESENKGNIHLRPQFFVDIFKRKEKIFSSMTRLGRPVLVEGKTSFRFKDKVKQLDDGKYKIFLKINYGIPYGFKNIIKEKKFKMKVKNGKYEIY